MATIRDVAKYAGVSVGTVSNVLNGSVAVREETRERVMAAIKALNYHPSAIARSLTTQRTNTIGVVRTELSLSTSHAESDPFILDLIDGLSSAARSTNTGVTYWSIPAGPSELALYERIVLGRQVDGLIVFALRKNDPRIAFLKDTDFPFVVFGHDGTNDIIHWIDVDGTHGVKVAIEHMAGLGHRRIGYIGPPGEQYLADQRWAGFVEGMRAAGLDIDSELVFEGDFTERSGQLGTHFLLDTDQPPTSILCNNDRMAFGAMRAIQSRGLEVGSDVSVVGFDDILLARYWQPPLTTLQQPIHEIGQSLFEMLQDIVTGENEEIASGHFIQPTLRIRQSTGPPR